MKKWKISYLASTGKKNSVEKWLDELTTDQLKSVAKELRLLELCGNDLKMPHSRAMSKGLFELRERRYGYRIYYGFDRGEIIILLTAGDKTTQKRDIEMAYMLLASITKQ